MDYLRRELVAAIRHGHDMQVMCGQLVGELYKPTWIPHFGYSFVILPHSPDPEF